MSKEVRSLPKTLLRESELEELKNELEEELKEIRSLTEQFSQDQSRNLEEPHDMGVSKNHLPAIEKKKFDSNTKPHFDKGNQTEKGEG